MARKPSWRRSKTPYIPGDELRVDQALQLLVQARELLTGANCPKTVVRVNLAISSAKGARRNVDYRRGRLESPRRAP